MISNGGKIIEGDIGINTNIYWIKWKWIYSILNRYNIYNQEQLLQEQDLLVVWLVEF